MDTPLLPGFFPEPIDIGERMSVPYAKDSETSKAGAKKVESIAGAQCQRLLAIYRARGPLTDCEARDLMGVGINIITARRNMLIEAGEVEVKGQRVNPHTAVQNKTWGVK